MEQFPFTDGTYSWWLTVQVVPEEGSRLRLLLGVAYVAFCMVQIAIIDFYNNTICMVGWVNRWAIFRPTEHFAALLAGFAMEVQQGTFANEPANDTSDHGPWHNGWWCVAVAVEQRRELAFLCVIFCLELSWHFDLSGVVG